jgi:hypothetical protein
MLKGIDVDCVGMDSGSTHVFEGVGVDPTMISNRRSLALELSLHCPNCHFAVLGRADVAMSLS